MRSCVVVSFWARFISHTKSNFLNTENFPGFETFCRAHPCLRLLEKDWIFLFIYFSNFGKKLHFYYLRKFNYLPRNSLARIAKNGLRDCQSSESLPNTLEASRALACVIHNTIATPRCPIVRRGSLPDMIDFSVNRSFQHFVDSSSMKFCVATLVISAEKFFKNFSKISTGLSSRLLTPMGTLRPGRQIGCGGKICSSATLPDARASTSTEIAT